MINFGKYFIHLVIILLLISSVSPSEKGFNFLREEPIIANHICTRIDLIPEYYIQEAKAGYRIAYCHTSHGGQIVSGMEVLRDQSSLYAFDHDGIDGALSLHDYPFILGDLGSPNRTEWYYRTRNLLDNPDNDRNMIMWSWCGQVSHSTEGDIDTYLSLMDQLEADYPDVIFVYMTGHLDGTGEEGNLHIRNNQIRQYCRENNKVLFDFADIESYDPDGTNFLIRYANDRCDYDSDGDGHQDANWADEWCASHPGECSSCSCAHSRSLNCDLKGRAFWWMMATLEGWEAESCDYNLDGVVNSLDYLDKQADIPTKYDDWVRDCWSPGFDCGDFNGDGMIDADDLDDKMASLENELAIWMQTCGIRKKGATKR
jgi:hypothetical protein